MAPVHTGVANTVALGCANCTHMRAEVNYQLMLRKAEAIGKLDT